MTMAHAAWTFDPGQFHSSLEKAVLQNNTLNEEKLLALAKMSLSNPSPSLSKALDFMRFDDDWFDPSIDIATNSYVIILASMLSLAPSLSDHFVNGYQVLEVVLPLAGWTEAETNELLRGHSLRRLVLESWNTTFISKFGVHVIPYGGWLKLSHVETLLSHLQSSKIFFDQPSQGLLKAIEWSKYKRENLAQTLQDAYSDAKEMLQTAINRKSALFMIID